VASADRVLLQKRQVRAARLQLVDSDPACLEISHLRNSFYNRNDSGCCIGWLEVGWHDGSQEDNALQAKWRPEEAVGFLCLYIARSRGKRSRTFNQNPILSKDLYAKSPILPVSGIRHCKPPKIPRQPAYLYRGTWSRSGASQTGFTPLSTVSFASDIYLVYSTDRTYLHCRCR